MAGQGAADDFPDQAAGQAGPLMRQIMLSPVADGDAGIAGGDASREPADRLRQQ
jgi:hypothetical protein